MTLAQLLAAFRVDADDHELPYLFSDARVIEWLNEAQEEACIRANLIFESADSELCEIYTHPRERSYALDERWICVTKAFLVWKGCATELTITDREVLDRTRPDWRTDCRRTSALMQFDSRVELDAAPTSNAKLQLEGFRLPLEPMALLTDSPEIGRTHHRQLVHWALHRGYSVPDTEANNPGKAAEASAAFEAVFGRRPDADLRKAWFDDTPHRNAAFWV